MTIFLEKSKEGHRQSDEHRNCFKDNVGETSERRGGAHMSFSERIAIILNGIWNCLKGNIGETFLSDGVERLWTFSSA